MDDFCEQDSGGAGATSSNVHEEKEDGSRIVRNDGHNATNPSMDTSTQETQKWILKRLKNGYVALNL